MAPPSGLIVLLAAPVVPNDAVRLALHAVLDVNYVCIFCTSIDEHYEEVGTLIALGRGAGNSRIRSIIVSPNSKLIFPRSKMGQQAASSQ